MSLPINHPDMQGGVFPLSKETAEQVLVFPAERLQPYLDEGRFKRGIETDEKTIRKILDDVLDANSVRFVDRAAAEVDPSFKQVIPYCVLCGEDAGKKYVFAYQRTKKGGEDRLHDKWSLGVGGHINPVDYAESFGGELPYSDPYSNGLFRELKEEVGLDLGKIGIAPAVALIYDPSNEVGKVHFGIVHLVKVPDIDAVEPTDPALASGQWTGPRTRMGLSGERKFENWSQLVHASVQLPA